MKALNIVIVLFHKYVTVVTFQFITPNRRQERILSIFHHTHRNGTSLNLETSPINCYLKNDEATGLAP